MGIVAIPIGIWMQSMDKNESGVKCLYFCWILGVGINVLTMLTFRFYANWERELSFFRLRARQSAANMHSHLHLNSAMSFSHSQTTQTGNDLIVSRQESDESYGEYGELRHNQERQLVFAHRRRRTFWDDLFGCAKKFCCCCLFDGCRQHRCLYYFCGCFCPLRDDANVRMKSKEQYHIDLDNDAKYQILSTDIESPGFMKYGHSNSMSAAQADYLGHSLISHPEQHNRKLSKSPNHSPKYIRI